MVGELMRTEWFACYDDVAAGYNAAVVDELGWRMVIVVENMADWNRGSYRGSWAGNQRPHHHLLHLHIADVGVSHLKTSKTLILDVI